MRLWVAIIVMLSGCAAPLGEVGSSGSSDGEHADAMAADGMDRPAFGTPKGTLPTRDAELPVVERLVLRGDDAIANSGFFSGAGSEDDPYVIEAIRVRGDLSFSDTEVCIEVRNLIVDGQLTLNWNGQCAWVHHNRIMDLRVNENVERSGYATGGYLERNWIGFVGQLRHYDGVFQDNVVGPRPAAAPFDPILETTPLFAPDVLVANVDGFNQGIIQRNEFYGSVTLDFHGHHHGSGFFADHSHYHGTNESLRATQHHGMPHDHTQRWTSVQFVDNRIVDHRGYGLQYEDRNHAGDDRTATSETEATLDEAHFHRTHVEIARNRIEGAALQVDIFNAEDELHLERNDGWLDIVDNHISLKERDRGLFGIGAPVRLDVAIRLYGIGEAQLNVTGNRLTFEPREAGPLDSSLRATAIRLEHLSDSHARVQDNRADGFGIGIDAGRWSDATWELSGNDMGYADEPLRTDDSVPDPW